jgi:hypothetical protein
MVGLQCVEIGAFSGVWVYPAHYADPRVTVEIAVALGSVWRSAKTSEH